MKKKMLAGLLAAAMVMTALTGCGAKDSSTKPAAESTAGAAAGTELMHRRRPKITVK